MRAANIGRPRLRVSERSRLDFPERPLPEANRLIRSLSAPDIESLRPHLRPVRLEHKRILYDVDGLVTAVYFPTTCVISLVVGLSTGESVEAAMVGRDGVVGASAALDGRISLSRSIVQLAGDAFECRVDDLANAAFNSRRLISSLIRHEQTVYTQAQQSAACMATMTFRPASADGYFVPAISLAPTPCLSRRSISPRCWASGGRASVPSRTRSSRRA